MEESAMAHLEGMLMCPVCQDIFTEPQQLPCGHSMCAGCLENLMDHTSASRFRCPDCRTVFEPYVRIQKSYALANVAEDVRKNRRRRLRQKMNVYCDCCPEKKRLAIKTCLKCEVSMCTKHVQGHRDFPAFTGHPLVWPLHDLQERKCPQHEDEVLRYYCNASRRYVCNMCALESQRHKHTTEALAVLRRQLTEHMDEHFTLLHEQISKSNNSLRQLEDKNQQENLKWNLVNFSFNSVTVALLCLWFIVLSYAYSYSEENMLLTQQLDEQQKLVDHLSTTITELIGEHPVTSYTSSEGEIQGSVDW